MSKVSNILLVILENYWNYGILSKRLQNSMEKGIIAGKEQKQMELLNLSQQVPIVNIICMVISGILIIFFPFYVYRQITKKEKIKLFPLILGCLAYIIFGILLPELVGILLYFVPGLPDVFNQPVLRLIYTMVITLIFDGCAFFFLVRLTKKKRGTIYHLLAGAVGYSGLKAVLIPGITIFSNITIATGINSVGLETIVSDMTAAEVEQIMTTLTPLLQNNPLPMLIIGLGQIASIIMYLALAVFLWLAAEKKQRSLGLQSSAALLLLFHLPVALLSAGIVRGQIVTFLISAAAAAGGAWLAIKIFPDSKENVKI